MLCSFLAKLKNEDGPNSHKVILRWMRVFGWIWTCLSDFIWYAEKWSFCKVGQYTPAQHGVSCAFYMTPIRKKRQINSTKVDLCILNSSISHCKAGEAMLKACLKLKILMPAMILKVQHLNCIHTTLGKNSKIYWPWTYVMMKITNFKVLVWWTSNNLAISQVP